MESGAHVSSVEAIEAFRTALLVYMGKSRAALDEASDEIARTREWLRSDRLLYWENQVRKRKRKLDDARQALFSGRLSTLREVRSAEQNAVHSAKRALNEAEDKLARVRQWLKRYESAVEIPARELERLRTIFVGEMPKGVAYLGQVVQKLDRYSERGSPRSGTEVPSEPGEAGQTPKEPEKGTGEEA